MSVTKREFCHFTVHPCKWQLSTRECYPSIKRMTECFAKADVLFAMVHDQTCFIGNKLKLKEF